MRKVIWNFLLILLGLLLLPHSAFAHLSLDYSEVAPLSGGSGWNQFNWNAAWNSSKSGFGISFSNYYADFTHGNYQTTALSANHQFGSQTLKALIGLTPSNNGYGNSFFQLENSFPLMDNHLHVSGGLTRINYWDNQNSATASATNAQTDVLEKIHWDIDWGKIELESIQSLYDKNPDLTDIRAVFDQEIGGMTAPFWGLWPSISSKINLQSNPLFGGISPFISYVHTTLRLGLPSWDSYTAGLALNLKLGTISLSYSYWDQPTYFPHANYLFFDISLKRF
jgi:hypothetical protein